MKRSFLLLIAFLLTLALLIPTSMFAQESEDDETVSVYRTVKVRLVSSSTVAWGNLKIDGRSRGRVRRGSYRTFRLRANRSHTFLMRRTYAGYRYKRFRSVFIPSGSTTKYVFLSPIKQRSSEKEGRGYVTLTLSSRSTVAYAYLTINGKSFGKLRRGSSRKRRFWLATGMRHKIVLKRTYRGRRYRKVKYVRVYEGQEKYSTFILRRRGGSSHDSDDGGSSRRYRRVKVKLTSTSKVAWAKLYVNGSYKGRLRRSSYKILRLRAGKRYRFKVTRRYRGRRYYRSKRVYIGRGRTTKTVFLHPMAR